MQAVAEVVLGTHSLEVQVEQVAVELVVITLQLLELRTQAAGVAVQVLPAEVAVH
jgi:hypothetical protein